MPGKMTTQVPAAVRSSRLSCGKVGKAQIFTSARESPGESRLSHSPSASSADYRLCTLMRLNLARRDGKTLGVSLSRRSA